ncbi:MAG: tetratricopeptide repeat protein, partial [Sedimentisphaerales bacterium]
PAFGTGLGTHQVVYPMFDRSTVAALAAYAENEYAQAAEETGCIGLGALVVFGIIIWTNYVRNIRNDSTPVLSAAYGLGFGLLAVTVHSLSDFGQHVPANAFLSATFCALLLVLAHNGRNGISPSNVVMRRGANRAFSVVALICVSGIWGWVLFDANNARLAEASWKQAMIIETNLMKTNWQADDQEYVELITRAAKASHYQPDNIKYRHWLNVYRWQSIGRLTDPNTGELALPPQAMGFVERIVEELNTARSLCPTFGATYCVVGQLQKFVLNDPRGAESIRKGYRLAPCNPVACFVMGLLDIEDQRINAAFEKFERAIQLDDEFFQSVVAVYINNLNRPDLAIDMAGDNISKLTFVANTLADMEEHKEVFEKAQGRAIELLKAKCAGSDVSADAFASLANICRRRNDIESAIQNYRRALNLDYGQVYWRYTLAQLLAAEDKVAEAIHEARICLRLRPQFAPAEKLIADLSTLPGEAMSAAGLP